MSALARRVVPLAHAPSIRYSLRLPVPPQPASSPPPLLPAQAPQRPAAAAHNVDNDELGAALAFSLESSAPDALTIRMTHPQGSSKVRLCGF
jgi:hypothetical protein